MEHELKPMNFYEMFPKVFEKGGFDAVVGNPPYGVSFSMAEKAYLKSKYSAMVGKYDSYGFFIERALSLQKYKGILGYIVPHTWLTVIEAKSLRALILEKTCINSIVRLPSKVFKDATVNAVLLFLRNEYDEKVRDNNILKVCLFDADKTLDDISESNAVINSIQQSSWNSETLMFNINISPEAGIVIKKISFNATTWDKIADFCVGVQAYDVYAGQKKEVIKNRAYHADSKKDDTYVKELNGSDVSRYMYKWQDGSWISYGPWLAHPRQPEFFEGSRILVREITDKGKYIIHGAYTEDRYVNYKTILNIKLKPVTLENGYKYSFFLGILNSSLMSFYFLSSSNKLVTNTFPRISILDMKRFPMRLIDFKDPKDKARHDNIAKLVEQMLATKEKLAASKTDAESNRLELQCAALDKQIDAAVYELYGLTDEEIRVVEGK
jgi:type I restriction-modification system DNA methylase subunit